MIFSWKKIGTLKNDALVFNDMKGRSLLIELCSCVCRTNIPGSPVRPIPQQPGRTSNVTPNSTPSPKKRQLPQIPVQAQQASRDRGEAVTSFTRSKNDLNRNLDCNLDQDPEDVPVYTLLFFIQSLLHRNPSNKMIAIQIECLHGTEFLDPDRDPVILLCVKSDTHLYST